MSVQTPEEIQAELDAARAEAAANAAKYTEAESNRAKAEAEADSLKIALQKEREKAPKATTTAPKAETNIEDIVERVRAESAKDVLEETIRSYGESDEERAAIRQAYAERKPSGYSQSAIEKDIRIAKATVHVDRLDLKPGSKTDKNLAAAMNGSGGKPANDAMEEISDKDREIAAQVGMAPEKYVKYKKQLGH